MSSHRPAITTRLAMAATPLAGLYVVERYRIEDDRGYLERLFCESDLSAAIGGKRIVQINHTLTRTAGMVRGLHFQHAPHAELKLVSCLRGQVFDVAVDLRRGSTTFLRWHAERLSEENQRSLLIPEGFAHGFQAMSDQCEMLYFHTAPYAPQADAGFNALDPRLGIPWPLPIGERSERDRRHPMIDNDFQGLVP